MKKRIIEYTLPYNHVVQIGIDTDTEEEAIAEATRLFDQGDIWDDTADVPLLYDDFEEAGDSGPLIFSVAGEVNVVGEAGDKWPEPDNSVVVFHQREAAFAAARLLVEAYNRGEERGGSVDWGDLDQAYQMALMAV